ncbi:hypothetical protein [Mumia sp. DW29H23]|uniref:hypothetical protein n=1 Tax=Mumia sp. DW29H23 TaxID=3421241 RepID=UPI003D683C11
MAAKKTESDDDAGVLSGVSTSQVVGSALAAVTAAVAGSWLGVAGTLIGAAVGSIVATIAGTIYTNSIRKSRQLAQAARLTSLATLAKRDPRGAGGTAVLPVPEALDAAGQPGDGGVEDIVDPEVEAERTVEEAEEAADEAARKKLITWRGVVAAAVVSLVLALGGIWAFEAVVGHPIGNSDKTGTTFSNVGTTRDDGDKKNDENESPQPSTPTESTDPSEPTPSAETTSPSEGEEPAPSEPTTPAPTTESTPSPTPEPTPNSEEDPSLGQSTPAPTDAAPTPSSVDG